MSKSNIVVEVEPRERTGTNASRRLRRAGRLPGIVYGLGVESFPVTVSPRKIDEIIRLESGRNTIFTLSMKAGDGSGRKRSAMIKELIRDPLTSNLLHVDLIRVDLAKTVTVSVPVRLTGNSEGVTEGGVMDFVHRAVEVECLPGDIPEHFDIDTTPLAIGQHVEVKDIEVGEAVRILDDPATVIASVMPPTKAVPTAEELEAAAEAAEEAPAEGEAAEASAEGEEEGSGS